MLEEIGDIGSAFTFYTEEERMRSIETGWKLPDEILKERMDESFQEWLVSEERLGLRQNVYINPVIEKYPNIVFNADEMEEIAETIELVREKFYVLREANMALEQATMDSYKLSKKGQNVHLTYLISFYYEYIRALDEKYRANELELILKLADILNEEFGNFTGLSDVPKFFLEGVGIGISNVIKAGTSILTDITAASLEGFLGKDWKRKLLIYGSVGIAGVIGSLILFYYSKTYIGKKATSKAKGE